MTKIADLFDVMESCIVDCSVDFDASIIKEEKKIQNKIEEKFDRSRQVTEQLIEV